MSLVKQASRPTEQSTMLPSLLALKNQGGSTLGIQQVSWLLPIMPTNRRCGPISLINCEVENEL